MLRQGTSSQKPADGLLAEFRQQFPQVGPVSTEAPAPSIAQTSVANHPIIINAPDHADSAGQNVDNEPFRDQDPTPRASHEPWRFTPSLLDPNSYAFNSFANAPPGYYTPTPGGNNTLFHSQAGDLHTPTLVMAQGLGTPLSMPTSGDGLQSGVTTMDMSGFQNLQPHQFHHFNPFIQAPPPQPGFAPSSFVHQDTGYETIEQDASPRSDPSDSRMQSMATAVNSQKFSSLPMGQPLPASAEKFRFHSTLNAPTAMVKHADEIPVTYLNKGQAYSLSIADTSGTIPVLPGTKYRTFVRVSFEDEEQRQKPSVCWGLWKEDRGTNEAHQRGGKLQAVEFVEAGQPADGDDKRTRIELETSSFDGFSVTWAPGVNGAPEVNIAVRFNFLSTDFSHSKGVKGIPVRLCAKTTLVSPSPAPDTSPETCFCKVKLFRDHGAERKLSNDVAHIKKSIDKLKQQLAQLESGMKDFGKRKRHSRAAKVADPQRPGKVPKHKRTWSMSSASSAGGGGARMTMEEDLHFKLQTLQDMFTSTRPVSVLYLRGDELDDPDMHPVALPGDMSPPNRADGAKDRPSRQPRSKQSSFTGSMVSPSPSSLSLASQASSLEPGGVWQNMDSATTGEVLRKGPDQPQKIARTDDNGSLSGWIEASGVDPSYRPPPERGERPVACFYIIRQAPMEPAYYRAVYLMKRTLKEFNGCIANKWGLDASTIMRTLHATQDGLDVEIDDDVVCELKEGQAMRLEVEVMEKQGPSQHKWDMLVDSLAGGYPTKLATAGGIVLRLKF
ncbi:hypothetical protein PLIIFM63780_010586 [Purpureocillium lilacinum]|nr:hypothetical protein PLIIFM63780_010586 [Purpureocillium lilacinum]